MADGSIVIDPGVATAVGVLFTTFSGAVGWLVSALWKDRGESQKAMLDMLSAQFQDNETRRALADKQAQTVDNLGRKIDDFGRKVDDLQREILGARQDIVRTKVG